MQEDNDSQRTRNLTDTERQSIVDFLLIQSDNGELKRGQIKETADKFECHRNTISAIWKRYQESISNDDLVGDVASKIKGNSGPKKKD